MSVLPGILVTVLLLAGCGDKRLEWKEQVRLQNGQELLVERTAAFSENYVPGGGGGSLNKGTTLRILEPANADNPAAWNAIFVPILFDRDDETKEWFIVATFTHCTSWYELERPKLPYTEYRYRNAQWVRQPLSPKWIGRNANVLPADLSDAGVIADSKPALTIERKERILANPARLAQFKKVVDHWSSGC